MNSIFPAVRTRDALLMAAQSAAQARYGEAGRGLRPAQSYFETTGSVQIGPYSGHLCYLAPPRANGPTRAIAELDEAVQKQRGLCRKLFDKVFRGISLDGHKRLSETQVRTFQIMDDVFGTAVESTLSNRPVEARDDIELMAACMEIMRNPSAALARIRAAGLKGDKAALADIVVSLSLPAVAEAAWRDAGTIRRLAALCSNSSEILTLAETGDAAPQRSALVGLRRMLDDDATIRHIADTLANEMRGKSFKEARELVLPYMIDGEHASFAKDRAGRDRVPKLWIALRDTVATTEDAAVLANDHVIWGLAPYHRAMNFVLSDERVSDRLRQSIIDRLDVSHAGNRWRISMENAREVAAFLIGTPGGESTRPGTVLSRSALQLIWGDPVIATAIDETARDAMAPGGQIHQIHPLRPLLRTHPNKAYVAQYCGVSPVIGRWGRLWTSRYGATEEIHADAGKGPQLANTVTRTFAVA